jgi:hemolysin III
MPKRKEYGLIDAFQIILPAALMPAVPQTLSPIAACESSSELDSACAPSIASSVSGLNATEIANSITHGLGLLLSLIAAGVLLHAAGGTSGWQFAACAVYAATMVAVYASSTASHLFWQPRLNHFLRMLDQGCIYLFIAGSFTPIAATFLHGGMWWILLAAMWAIATAGFISKLFLRHRIDCASVAVPLLLGWLPLMGGKAMLELIPAGVLWWMLAGGVCYTVGTLFLMNDNRHRYLHAAWHLWVIAGTACQFWAILRYTVQAA